MIKVGDVIKYDYPNCPTYVIGIFTETTAIVLKSGYKDLPVGYIWGNFYINAYNNRYAFNDYKVIGKLDPFTRALHGF